MVSTFIPEKDLQVKELKIKIYKFGVKIHTKTIKKEQIFKKGVQQDYEIELLLPSIVPRIFLQLRLVMVAKEDRDANCIKFDLDLSKKFQN